MDEERILVSRAPSSALHSFSSTHVFRESVWRNSAFFIFHQEREKWKMLFSNIFLAYLKAAA